MSKVTAMKLPRPVDQRPTIVCLCGSTRFWRAFQQASLRETLDGKIVLSIGAATSADGADKTFGGYRPAGQFDAVKRQLDELHKRKLDLCDEAFILNIDDYIGDSTKSEVKYAREIGKRIRWLVFPSVHALPSELERGSAGA